jgi:hypothetical protein
MKDAYKASLPEVRKRVVRMIQSRKYQSVVEVGIWRGDLSKLLWSSGIGRLVLVDPMSVDCIQCWHDEWRRKCEPGSGRFYVTQMGNPKPKNGRFYTQEEMDALWNSVRETAPDWVEMVRLESVEAAKLFEDGSFDAVFIDGSHFYEDVCADIDAWLPKVDEGGVLCGDDYHYEGVYRAVDEKFPNVNVWGNRFWWVDI